MLQATNRDELLDPEERRRFVGLLGLGADEATPRRALALKAEFEGLLANRRAAIEKQNAAAFKEEADTYRRSTEGTWLEEREKYYEALSAAEYLWVRSRLVAWLIDFLGDVLRSKAGVTNLALPELETESARFAADQDLDRVLARLEALQELRVLLNTNVSEGLAIEVAFQRAFGA